MDKTKETENQVYRSYKDRLFRMVFREKKELLGLYEEGVAAGIEQGRTEGRLVGEEQLLFRLICTKLKKGKTPEVIAEELEEDVSRVEQICEKAKSFAPEYDWKKVYEQMKQL